MLVNLLVKDVVLTASLVVSRELGAEVCAEVLSVVRMPEDEETVSAVEIEVVSDKPGA